MLPASLSQFADNAAGKSGGDLLDGGGYPYLAGRGVEVGPPAAPSPSSTLHSGEFLGLPVPCGVPVARQHPVHLCAPPLVKNPGMHTYAAVRPHASLTGSSSPPSSMISTASSGVRSAQWSRFHDRDTNPSYLMIARACSAVVGSVIRRDDHADRPASPVHDRHRPVLRLGARPAEEVTGCLVLEVVEVQFGGHDRLAATGGLLRPVFACQPLPPKFLPSGDALARWRRFSHLTRRVSASTRPPRR